MRPKQPFTLAIAAMLVPGQPLYDLAADTVLSLPRSAALFDPAAVKSVFARLGDGTPTPAALVWSLLVLEMWLSVRNVTCERRS
ncbi:asparagine synthase-related protein [Nocardia sp. NPDC050793]|uniref:asparagine synthase-related protein n=1 Tax=Nocardia sp. NPDC050793 TaxID=3155159 RepID=UPI003404051A